MATNKLIGLEDINLVAKDYATRLKTKVDAQEGHGLYPDVDKTKLNGVETGAQVNKIEEVELNGQAFSISGKKASGTIDAVTSTTLTSTLQDYISNTNLSDKLTEALPEVLEALDFMDEDAIVSLIEGKIEKIGTVQGSCTKSDLATKKTTANLQDIWIITDDNNHAYMFVGEGKPGAENGFIDLGGHYDLTNYAEKTYVDGKVDGLASEDYVDNAVEGMLTETDLASSEEVLAEIQKGVQAANQA